MITRLRTNANISQERFAELFDVSRQAVQKWENNLSVPELEKLIKISKHFDVSLDALVLESGTRITEELNSNKTLKPNYANIPEAEAYCSNLEAQLHVPSIPWSVPYILIGLGSLIAAIILMIFRLRSVSKMLKGIDTQKKGALL